jgi:hypothetical protein
MCAGGATLGTLAGEIVLLVLFAATRRKAAIGATL